MLKHWLFIIFGVFFCWALILTLTMDISAQTSQPSSVLYKNEGRLTYVSDEEGNRIPDFSHAGYRGGGVELPYYPVKITVEPRPGDDTQRINGAIRYVESLPRDKNGVRGAVLLKNGSYEISGKLQIRKSGVVLRGSGSGSDPLNATILQVSKSFRGTVIQVGNDEYNWFYNYKVPRTYITTEFVPVGSRNFEVEDVTSFNVGDNIILRQSSSQKWLDAINGGDTDTAPPWQEGYIEIYYNRTVTAIKDSTLSIDAPVFNHLDQTLADTRVYKLSRENLVEESGVEYLRISILTNGETSDNHTENGILFTGVENGWARNVNVLHFRSTGIGTFNSKNITVVNSGALEPHSKLSGERRYNFNAQPFSNNILFENVTSSNGRRSFVSNGTSVTSGIVFLNSRSVGAFTSSEGHQKWSQGLLYDNITFENPRTHFVLGLYNRGSRGSSHGWGAVHSVAWNVDGGGQQIIIQKPPTAQNYGIGNKGTVTGKGPFDHPAGYIEGTDTDALPASLYKAQLEERLKFGVPPDAPARLTVSNQKNNQLDLKWHHSSVRDTRFIIERSKDGGNTFEKIDIIRDSDSSYTDKTVQEQIYHYRVRAEDANGKSAYSNMASGEPVFTNDYLGEIHLSMPENYSEFSIDSDPDQLLVFEWEQAESTLHVDYTLLIDKTDEDFSNPLAEVKTDAENRTSFTVRDVINLLSRADIAFENKFQVKWTVKANSKTVERWSSDVNVIELVKNLNSNILDETDKETELSQNYPNPFNPVTTILFYLKDESDVSLDVYDLAGVRIATVNSGKKEAGYHSVTFDGSNLASGVYLYRLQTDNFLTTRKMVLIK